MSKKPEDVTPSYWLNKEKISNIAATGTNLPASTQRTANKRERESSSRVAAEDEEVCRPPLLVQAGEEHSRRKSPAAHVASNSVVEHTGDVNARIRSLQTELRRLQKSREVSRKSRRT